MIGAGHPFSETELWAISFGSGRAEGGSRNDLYFTAGLDGNTNGLLGSLSVPEPSSAALGLIAVGVLAGGWMSKNRQRVTAA